jgi:hypothetical protein
VGAITPLAETWSHRLPDKNAGAPSGSLGSRSGPARFAPARSGSDGDAVSVRQLASELSGSTRRACREPSAPSAERALTGCPIADAPAGSQAPSGSAPIRCRRLAPREGALTREPGARGTPSCLATAQRARPGAPHPLRRALVAQDRRRRPESNRAQVAARRTDFAGLTGRSIEDATAGPTRVSRGASCRRAPSRDASKWDVRTQLVKEHPGFSSTSTSRSTQLGERRASRRVTRFNRLPREVPAFSAGT